jgi:chromate transporter
VKHRQRGFIILARLFWVFLKAGTFTFAGGLAMLPLIQKDVIDKYRMLDDETFLEYAALSQTLPGMIALNCAIFVGKSVGGVPGAVAAGLGTVLPAFVLMLAATLLINFIPRTGRVENAFKGVRAASAALILHSAIKLGKKGARKAFPAIVALISFALVLFFKISAFPVILAAAAAGVAVAFASGRSAAGGQGAAGAGQPSSQGDGRSSDQGDGRSSDQGDGTVSSQGDSRSSSQGDGRSSSQGDSRVPSQGGGQLSSQGDGTVSSQSDRQPSSQGETPPARRGGEGGRP